jgi:serine/threonine-protein kinase
MTDTPLQMTGPGAVRCGGYELLREVAQGFYTTVYEARHPLPKMCERPVALKLLRQGIAARHFMLAAQINAFLDHPRIPPLYEVGEAEGQLFTARKFVVGDDLQNGIGAATRSLLDVTTLVSEVAGVLDYAHSRGVIHGFVHPRHILCGNDGTAWLIGFGEYPPAEAMAFGNPLHLAPEQLDAWGAATPASDVYALAETALWLLSGRHPFSGLRHTELLAAKRTAEPRRQGQGSRPSVSSAVEKVLCQGIAAEPSERYATAGEFASALVSAGPLAGKSKRWWFWR